MSTTETQDAALEAAARAYFGIENVEFPSDPDRQARSRARWDTGRVEPHIKQHCRDAVRPLVLAALNATTNEGATDRG